MAISFDCPGCGIRHTADEAMANTRARCQCGTILRVPGAKRSAPADGCVTVRCSACGAVHKADASLAGKAARCRCGAVVCVPGIASSGNEADDVARGVSSLFDEISDEEMQAAARLQAAPIRGQPRSDDKLLADYTKADQWKTSQSVRSYDTQYHGFFGLERRVIDGGILGGSLAMLAALVWFVAGLAGGRLFFYPPILFAIGLFALLKSLLGND